MTKSATNDYDANWSPDGQKIAFVSDRAGLLDIFKMKARPEGRRNRPVRLTSNVGVIDVQPAWSPDGQKITFSRNRDGNYEIYVMAATGASQTNKTNSLQHDVSSDWQPVPEGG
jgi:Tol biopolymer transport system component